MNIFDSYYNPNNTPIAEITYEIPQDSNKKFLDILVNPVITIKYADGRKSVFDTNLIYKRGYDQGVKRTEAKIKRKLGLS